MGSSSSSSSSSLSSSSIQSSVPQTASHQSKVDMWSPHVISNAVNLAIYVWLGLSFMLTAIVLLFVLLFRRGFIFKEISALTNKSNEVMGGLVSQFKGILFVTNDDETMDDTSEDSDENRRSSFWSTVARPFRSRPSVSMSDQERQERRQSCRGTKGSLPPPPQDGSPTTKNDNAAAVTTGNSLKLTLAIRLILFREYLDYAKYCWKEMCTTLYLRRGTVQSLHQPASLVQQTSASTAIATSAASREASYYGILNRLELVVERIRVINNFLNLRHKREQEEKVKAGKQQRQPAKKRHTLRSLAATGQDGTQGLLSEDETKKDQSASQQKTIDDMNDDEDSDEINSLTASSHVLHVMINDLEDLMKLMSLASIAFNRFTNALRNVRAFMMQFTMIIFIIFLPLYCLLSHYFASYTFKYAWYISLAFLSGIPPAVGTLFLLILLLLWIEKRIFDTFGGENHFRHKIFERERRREEKDKRLRITASTTAIAAAAAVTSFASSAVAVAIAVGNELKETIQDNSDNINEDDDITTTTDALHGLEGGGNTTPQQQKIQREKLKKQLQRRMEHIIRLEKKFKLYWYLRAVFVIVSNIITVVAINAAYVYATTSKLTKFSLLLIKLSISTFKLIWALEMTARFYHNYMNYPMKELKRLAIEYETVSLQLQELDDDNKTTDSKGDKHVTSNNNKNDEKEKQLKKRNYKAYDNFLVQMLIYLSMFNSVIAPVLAVAFVSADCFYYVLNTPPEVTVEYSFLECTAVYATPLTTRCIGIDRVTQSTSYTPSYQYTYECSSSLMTSFGDVFLYRYLISGCLMPLINIFMKYVQEVWYLKSKPQDDRQFQSNGVITGVLVKARNTSNKIYFSLYAFLTEYLPPSAWLLSYVILSREILEEKEKVRAKDKEKQRIASVSLHRSQKLIIDSDDNDNDQVNPMIGGSDHAKDHDKKMKHNREDTTDHTDSNTSNEEGEDDKELVPGKNVFNTKKFVILLVSDIAMIFTFGTIFPPIALIICLSIMVDTSMNQMSLYRALSISTAIISNLQNYYQNQTNTGSNNVLSNVNKENSTMLRITYQDALLVKCLNNMAIIIRECNAIDSLLNRSISSVIIIAAAFWSFFLFDIYGDVSPFPNALWVLLVMSLTPVAIWFVRSYVTEKVKKKLMGGLGSGKTLSSSSSSSTISTQHTGIGRVDDDPKGGIDIELKPMK